MLRQRHRCETLNITERQTATLYLVVELKECRVGLSDIKRLRLQTSSVDAGNNLLAGRSRRRPERHAGARSNLTPIRHWNVLTTLNAKLQFTPAAFFNQCATSTMLITKLFHLKVK